MDDRMLDDGEETRVEDGAFRSWDGKRVHLSTLIQRRWGWPKMAAKRAAKYLQAQAERDGRKSHLELAIDGRTAQQAELFSSIPGLVENLCTGIAHRSKKSAHHMGNTVTGIVVRFPTPITDDGLTQNIIAALANRLGCSSEEMRGRHCPVCARSIPRGELEASANHIPCPDCDSPTLKVCMISSNDGRVTLDVMANLFEVQP